MPILPPQLDDLRYDRTYAELIRRIPVYTKDWTDHNDSDPGITLIQLFSYLAEQVCYRLNRIPEKNEVELLKLLGIRLKPARAATTRLAFQLADPATTEGFTLAAGARARTKLGNPPPVFETDVDIDIVPAESNLFLLTKNPFVWDLRRNDSGALDPIGAIPDPVPNDDTPWLTVLWDGKKPKSKDMPLEPVTLFGEAGQRFLWIGLDFNPARDAGFLGVGVTLTIQFDDDEQPSLTAVAPCDVPRSSELPPTLVDWLAYYDVGDKTMQAVPGRVNDTTQHLTRSGTITFTVPLSMGAIPRNQYANFQEPAGVSALDACLQLAQGMNDYLTLKVSPTAPFPTSDFQTALVTGIQGVQNKQTGLQPLVAHLLDPKYRDPLKYKGWLRLALPAPLTTRDQALRIRMITFNVARATNAVTVTNELVGVADGRPGQTYQLAHQNVLDGTLEIGVQEDPDQPLTTWDVIDSLDAATSTQRVYDLDPEAGEVFFGNGIFGRIPALVPSAGNIVALKYRYGGGKSGETGVGTVTALETQRAGIAGVTNIVNAMGGADTETLDQAERRARKELSTRDRAVTASDFEWIASQTPSVRVARAHVVPRRRPLPSAGLPPAIAAPTCGAPLAAGPSGLDTLEAAGVVSVVAVPDLAVPEPVPTPTFLRRVAVYLDAHRLITTEVYVVPAQYLRVCDLVTTVVAAPGYTRAQLQDLIGQRLSIYLHVLTGGEDGGGFPFGGQVHIADLMAQIYRVEGVERVDSLSARFTHTKSNVDLRQGRLVFCPANVGEVEEVQLGAEENVSFDAESLTVSTLG
jgi:hypothetical protein